VSSFKRPQIDNERDVERPFLHDALLPTGAFLPGSARLRYRLVLILRHFQEMTYEEMAEVLSIPVGTIKTHLFRARRLLKEALEGAT
jgi:RNA polymerase sigma factor (sigma-70 family)